MPATATGISARTWGTCMSRPIRAPGSSRSSSTQRAAPAAIPTLSVGSSRPASPEKTLQPDGDSENAGTAIVLGDPGQAAGAVHVPNAWHVTSPLLPDTQ